MFLAADLRGGLEGPGGPNSFNFMQFLGKYGKIVYWRPLGSWRPLLGEILDPALVSPELNLRNPSHVDEEAGKGGVRAA